MTRATRNVRLQNATAAVFQPLEARQLMAADLVIENVTVVSGATEPAVPGTVLTLRYTVANRGTSGSGKFSVAAFQSSSATITGDEELLPFHTFTAGLGAGSSYTTTLNYTLGSGGAATDFDNSGTVGFDVDIFNEVAESNESNNMNRGEGVSSITFRYEGDVMRNPSTTQLPTATAIPAGGVVNGAIGDEMIGDRDIDAYYIDCVAGRFYEADVDSPSFNHVDTTIRIYDQGFNLVAMNRDLGNDGRGYNNDPYVQWSAPTSGRYFVVVSAAQNDTADPRLMTGRVTGGTGQYAMLVRQLQLPTVKISITGGTLTEGGATGRLTFTRTGGPIDRDLFIKYETYGTADASDLMYANTTGIIIPAGQSTAYVDLFAFADGITEPIEYRVFSLLPDQMYVRDAVSSSVPVYVQDDPALRQPVVTSSGLGWDTSDGVYFFFAFDQDVTGFGGDDITLKNNTTGATYNGTQFVTYKVNNSTYGISFREQATHTLPDGQYTFTLRAGAVTNVGNKPNDVQTASFHLLAGDANHDGKVDFADLLKLSQNYGSSNQTFGNGNFNYDPYGKVDFDDLLILSQRYGINYNTPSLVAAPATMGSNPFATRKPIATTLV